MNYTIITKSGWSSDGWRVRGTFAERDSARAFMAELRQTDPREDGYHVAVKAHRLGLMELEDGTGLVRFSDGTLAELSL